MRFTYRAPTYHVAFGQWSRCRHSPWWRERARVRTTRDHVSIVFLHLRGIRWVIEACLSCCLSCLCTSTIEVPTRSDCTDCASHLQRSQSQRLSSVALLRERRACCGWRTERDVREARLWWLRYSADRGHLAWCCRWWCEGCI